MGGTDWNRTLSLLAAAVTLAIALAISTDLFARLLAAEVGIVVFIWFSDAIGSYTGILIAPAVTQETPGCVIRAFGWLAQILVLLAVIAFGIRTVGAH